MKVYEDFLSNYDYDVRKTGDARWIDQKCTYDVVSIIADCIIMYTEEDHSREFTVKDIWHSDYAVKNVELIFSKPNPKKQAKNEYDKYFSQPIKLFSYSKLLKYRKKGNRYIYSISNREILERISVRAINAFDFLIDYITKVLKDSELYPYFDSFFKLQTEEEFVKLKKKFIKFTIDNTKINKEKECGRIFAKVLNPLAFNFKKKGTERGYLSPNIITFHDLMYNKPNFRDEYSGKAKNITRKEYESEQKNSKEEAYDQYTIGKAKRNVKAYNEKINEGRSEVKQGTERGIATQAHHIFPKSQFPAIAASLENLIMLTPNQHYTMAHPENKTQIMDKDFQYICLLAKIKSISEDLTNPVSFYSMEELKHVLDEGLGTDEFESIPGNDIESILYKLDGYYEVNEDNNKYGELIEDNKVAYIHDR